MLLCVLGSWAHHHLGFLQDSASGRHCQEVRGHQEKEAGVFVSPFSHWAVVWKGAELLYRYCYLSPVMQPPTRFWKPPEPSTCNSGFLILPVSGFFSRLFWLLSFYPQYCYQLLYYPLQWTLWGWSMFCKDLELYINSHNKNSGGGYF